MAIPCLAACLSLVLLRSGGGSDVDEAAIRERVAAFVTACVDPKVVDPTDKEIAALGTEYANVGRKLATAESAGDAPGRELAAECRKARKSIADGFAQVVKSPHAAPHVQAKVLAVFGPEKDEGEALAAKALTLDHVTAAPEALAAALRALGATRKPKYVDTFEKQLRSTDAVVLNAAAHALGEYFGEKEAARKDIAGALVLAYSSAGMSAPSPYTSGPKRSLTDSGARAAIAYEFKSALARLTGGTQCDDADKWSEWYRANKAAKWPDGLEKSPVVSPAECPVVPTNKH